MKPILPLFLALLLAACNAAATPPQAAAPETTGAVAVTPQGSLPEGGACESDIARYRAIQENDHAMGHVAQSVYDKIKQEIAAAEAECSEGHSAHARAMILASEKRHGYPTGL